MEFKKVIPALALTLGLAASVAQAATPQNNPAGNGYQGNNQQQQGLFQLNEVNPNGTPVANDGDDASCGAASCGSDDGNAGSSGDDASCGAASCGSNSDDGDDGSDHKCGGASCGAAE